MTHPSARNMKKVREKVCKQQTKKAKTSQKKFLEPVKRISQRRPFRNPRPPRALSSEKHVTDGVDCRRRYSAFGRRAVWGRPGAGGRAQPSAFGGRRAAVHRGAERGGRASALGGVGKSANLRVCISFFHLGRDRSSSAPSCARAFSPPPGEKLRARVLSPPGEEMAYADKVAALFQAGSLPHFLTGATLRSLLVRTQCLKKIVSRFSRPHRL